MVLISCKKGKPDLRKKILYIMKEVCSKDYINWLKYDNHRNTNNIHKSEERTILRKWIKIKVDLIKINKYNYFVYKIVIAFF